MTPVSKSRIALGGFLEPIGHFKRRGTVVSVSKALSLTNETRPYKSAHGHDIGHDIGHDMSCPYDTNYTLFADWTT